ncbi:MAG: sarcosine oxidase subunit gamma family protein [Arenicellales bacterium]|jgi:sarcosine oxidase subunit gamma|nr:sarcosine oxidase subunit gamma family protein [Arenicellales bacterium]MDP7524164.1 sarcosine oxidase subunit gamma family protein [Arenicellales bacterium]
MNTRFSPLSEFTTPQQRFGASDRLDCWLEEQAFLAHFNLRGDPQHSDFLEVLDEQIGLRLPLVANTVSVSQQWRSCWLGPDEWLLLGPKSKELPETLMAGLNGMHYSLVDLSGGQTVIRIGGPAWRDVLGSACTLDLHPRAFEAGRCAQTVLAHSNVLLIHVDADERGEALDIVVRRSFADHLLRWLIDAAMEVGFELHRPRT